MRKPDIVEFFLSNFRRSFYVVLGILFICVFILFVFPSLAPAKVNIVRAIVVIFYAVALPGGIVGIIVFIMLLKEWWFERQFQKYEEKGFKLREAERAKHMSSIKDIIAISTALTEYIIDQGVAPRQFGGYDENSKFYKALSPSYLRIIPIKDKWGNDFRVYCGEGCNDIYRGISGCNSRDFIVVSFGRDGKKEDWEYDPNYPKGGFYDLIPSDNLDKDIVNWNGSFIRAPGMLGDEVE